VDIDALVRVELDELQPAECSDVLILLPNWLAAALDLDSARLACQSLRPRVAAAMRVESVQETDGVRARRAEASPVRGDIRDRGYLDRSMDPGERERLADQLMLELFDTINDLGHRIAGPDLVVEFSVH